MSQGIERVVQAIVQYHDSAAFLLKDIEKLEADKLIQKEIS